MTQTVSYLQSIPPEWQIERFRLRTFSKYPHDTAKSAILLAEDGFAYVGTGQDSDDTVKCVFCSLLKRGWRIEDSIREAHKNLSPTCPMVTETTCGNVRMEMPKHISFDQEPYGAGSVVQPVSRASAARATSTTAPASSRQQKRHVQMATTTVVSSTPAAVSSEQGRSTVNLFHPSDDDCPSTTVTSSANSRSYPADVAGPSSVRTGQGGGASHPVGNIAGTGHSANPSQSAPGPANGSGAASGSQSKSVSSTSSNSSTLSNAAPPSSGYQANATNTSNNQQSSSSASNQQAPRAASNTHNTQSSSQTPTQTPSAPNNQAPGPPGNQPPPPANPANPTYHELGIITERPKRYEYAVRAKRLETFGEWSESHHLKKEELADAGFYYAGYGDCGRCFYCGGGLRNWERDDDVWVEHARWFPKCAYMRQRVGQLFVDTVADLARSYEKIPFNMVVEKMNVDPTSFQIDSKDTPLKNDAAVSVLREVGYSEEDLLPAAAIIKESSQILSADELFDAIYQQGTLPTGNNFLHDCLEAETDPKKDEEILRCLKQQNNDLRLQFICKVCMDKEVAVVFLPCGHMVCCTECASAMRDCPVCRKQVKGIVRGFMG